MKPPIQIRGLTSCRLCPRLASYVENSREKLPKGWCRPVPGFGDPRGHLLILGLAPGFRGANRTGRPFTGDAAGVWLYRALHEVGIASKSESLHRRDGLELKNAWLTNVVKCVPPGNRPSRQEFRNCRRRWLESEFDRLRNVRTILALGADALRETLDLFGLRPRTRFPFSHGGLHELPTQRAVTLVDSYHPSRQNTNTGRLGWTSFLEVVKVAHSLSCEPFKNSE